MGLDLGLLVGLGLAVSEDDDLVEVLALPLREYGARQLVVMGRNVFCGSLVEELPLDDENEHSAGL